MLVLSCIDSRAETAVGDLAYATGMPPGVVEEIVARLLDEGAVVDGSARLPDSPPDLEVVGDGEPDDPGQPPEEPAAPEVPEESEAAHEDAEDAALAGESATGRKLFETELGSLTRDVRLSRVGTAIEPHLGAFCFDPDPAVIHRLFENPRAGLAHARLVAFHHRTSAGLEALASHQSLLRDGQVQRLLLRNIQLPSTIFGRIVQPRRLLETWKILHDRDVPERTRGWARSSLRTKWTSAEAEERIELVWSTEGRVLLQLAGLTLDSKSTALLCRRQFLSLLLVRNLATWSATPPPLIGHLLKQALVRRQPQLRNLLLRHPNTPAEAKRKG